MPGDSCPAKDAGAGLLPVTLMVKSAAVAVPPKLFTTCLITVSCAATSSLVIVHVFSAPATTVTAPVLLQSPLKPVCAYPVGAPSSLTT